MRAIGGVDLPIPRHPGLRVFADTIDINRKTEQLVATGNVTFTGPDGHISADRIEFNIKDGTARFHHAAGFMSIPGGNRAEFGNQDPDVYFWGDLIEKPGPRKYVLSNGYFTTCVQPTPRWALGSNKITINLDEYVLARNTVFSVKGVPLLFLPAMYYPLRDDGRSTGILMPKYGASTFRGPSLSNAFFWAIGRSQDATFFHDWFTRTGTGMGSEYRYLSGVGSSGLFRFYRLNQHQAVFDQDNTTTTLPAQTTYQVDAAVSQSLGRRLRAQGNVEYFSDIATQQLYQQNTYARSSSRRMISGGVTGVYGPATVGGYYSRSEQFSDTHNSTVYGSTPRATASIAPSKLFGSPVYASMSSEYVFQPNRRLQDGIVTSDESLARFDVAPALRVPLSRLTYLSVTTNAVYRQTYFSRSLDASGDFHRRGGHAAVPVAPDRCHRPGLLKDLGHAGERILRPHEACDRADAQRGIPDRDREPGARPDLRFERRRRRRRGEGHLRGDQSPDRQNHGGSGMHAVRPGSSSPSSCSRRITQILKTSLFDTNYVSYSGRLKPIDFSPIAFTARVSPTPMIDANARVEYDVTGNGLQILTAGSTITTGAGSTNVGFSRQRFTPTVGGQQLSHRVVVMEVRTGPDVGLLRAELGHRRQVHLQPEPRRHVYGSVLRGASRLPNGQLPSLGQLADSKRQTIELLLRAGRARNVLELLRAVRRGAVNA